MSFIFSTQLTLQHEVLLTVIHFKKTAALLISNTFAYQLNVLQLAFHKCLIKVGMMSFSKLYRCFQYQRGAEVYHLVKKI